MRCTHLWVSVPGPNVVTVRPPATEVCVHPDTARELKARILEQLLTSASARSAGEHAVRPPRVAVGLAPFAGLGTRVAVRLESEDDRAALPDLGAAAAAEVDVEVIGPVRALSGPAAPGPADLRQRIRPLRPGLSMAHASVTAGTLGGFVRTPSGLAMLSNNHVLAGSDAAAVGDAVLQPGPADGGAAGDRVATLAAFQRFTATGRNLVDAALAILDEGVAAEPGDLPGGPLGAAVPESLDIEPDEWVEKVGRTTGHTHGRITAVEVDGVAVQYDHGVLRFDDQVEIQGARGSFSEGGDSGSVIWRSRDRAPLALLFAGSQSGGPGGTGVTFANPLATVLAALGARWVDC
jgi:hypothetical protein